MSWTAASGAPPSAASAAASHKTRPSLSFNFGTSTVSAQHQQQHFSGDPYAVHSPALAAGGENEQHGRAAANSSIVGNGSSSRARTRSRPGSHQPQVSSSSSSSQHAGAAAAQQQQQYQQQHYHALRYTWDVWFSSRVPGQKQQQQQRSEHVVEQQQHHHQSEHDEVAAQAQAAAAPDHHHQQQQQQQQTGKNKATPTTAGGVPLVGNKEKETREEWEGAVERLGGFSTLESLFPFLSWLSSASDMPASRVSAATAAAAAASGEEITAGGGQQQQPPTCDLHVFRAPITPSWEDAANSGGGRFVVRLRKGLADRVFDELVCALACERIPGQDVNGLVLSTRKDEDVVAVWVRSLGRERRESIRELVRAALAPLVPESVLAAVHFDWKPHPAAPPAGTSVPSSERRHHHHHPREHHAHHHHPRHHPHREPHAAREHVAGPGAGVAMPERRHPPFGRGAGLGGAPRTTALDQRDGTTSSNSTPVAVPGAVDSTAAKAEDGTAAAVGTPLRRGTGAGGAGAARIERDWTRRGTGIVGGASTQSPGAAAAAAAAVSHSPASVGSPGSPWSAAASSPAMAMRHAPGSERRQPPPRSAWGAVA